MAKEATTPNRTVADNINIRGNVSRLISKDLKQTPVKPLVQSLNALPAAERNSRLLQASTAMYRATKDRNFKPSQEQIKDFAAACEIIAEKRGIATQKDGSYSKEALNNELSPKALMQVYAAQTLKDSGENDASRQQIGADLKAGYGEGELPQEVLEVQQVPPSYADIMTDDDILAMTNEEERDQIIAGMSPLDQDRLNKKLEDKKKAEDNAFEENAGEARRRRDDPDWAKDDDNDNFKIEQGDIIEYLMKDIILASAAWAANKAAGLGGIVLYETASGIYKHAIRPAGQYTGKVISDQWNNFKALFGKKENENTEAKEILDDVIKRHDSIVEESKKRQIDSEEKTKKLTLFNDYLRNINSNFVVFGDNDDKIYKQSKTGWKEENFKEIRPSAPEELKELWKMYRDANRKEQLETLKKKFPNENIETWFDQQVKFEEDYVRTQGNPTIKEPADPGNKYFNALTEIRADQNMRLDIIKEVNAFNYQMELFAAHYSTYKYIELCRQNPENKTLSNREEVDTFLKNAHLEARQIFLTAEKQRRIGNSNISSRETLVDEAEKMMKTSRNLAEKKDKKPVKDKFRSIMGEEQISEDNVKTLLSEYKNPDPAERYAAEMFNCDALEREQRLNKEDLNERRKRLNESKTRCNDYLNKGKPEAEKRDIGKTYEIRKQSQGRH